MQSDRDGFKIKNCRQELKKGQWTKLDVTFAAKSERAFFFSTPYGNSPKFDGANHISWADSASWDSQSQCLHYYGGGHLTQPAFIRLCAGDLKWTYGPRPSEINYSSENGWDWSEHAYDNNTFDPATRTHFAPFQGNIYAYDLVLGKWRPHAQAPIQKIPGFRKNLTYFPGLGLVFIQGMSNEVVHVYLLREGEDKWTQIAKNIPNTTGRNMSAQYNPTSDVMIFGGGTRSSTDGPLLRLERDGSIKEIKYPSILVHSGWATQAGSLTDDPASGNFIYTDKSQRVFEYITSQDRWVEKAPSPFDMYKPRINTSIPEYGVIMMYSYNQGLLLYNPNREACP